MIIVLCVGFANITVVHKTIVGVGISVMDGEWLWDTYLVLYEWMFLVIVVSINGFVTNVERCWRGAGMIMCGMCLEFGIERGVGEKSKIGFDTILDNRESRNHPIEWITLGFES